MSGGSWNYVYRHFEEAASSLLESKCPKRRAFGELVELCSRAMHDIEWVDSCDYGKGDEIEAIKKALAFNGKEAECGAIYRMLDAAIDLAEKLKSEMQQPASDNDNDKESDGQEF